MFLETIIDIFKENFWGQAVGVIAFFVSIYNFLYCKNKKFVVFSMIASAVWGLHFNMIGLTTAAFVNLIDVFKNALALKYEKSKILASIFTIIYLVIGFFTYDGYVSLIPTINAILGTFLIFFIRGVWLNIGFMFVVLLWAVYNFIGQSIGGFATDMALFVIGIIGVIKIISNEKKSKKEIQKNKKEVEKELETVN